MRAKMVGGMIAVLLAVGTSAAGLQPLGTVSLPNVGSAGYVAAEGGYAYVTGPTNQGVALVVIDVSNPTAPREVSRLVGVGGYPIAVSGQYVYVYGGALVLVDVSTPTAPVIVGSLPQGSGPRAITVSDGYVYGANDSGLHIIDARNPAALVEVGTVAIPSAAGVALSDPSSTICTNETYAYVSSLDGSLRVVDVTNPAAPWLVGTLALGWGEAWGVATSAQYAYVTSFPRQTDPEYEGDPMPGKLHVIDVSIPNNPVIVASRQQARACHDVELAGGYAYLVEESTDFNATYDDTSVVDVRTPTQPTEVARMRTPRAWDLAVVGSNVYVPQNGYPMSFVVYQAYTPAAPGGQ